MSSALPLLVTPPHACSYLPEQVSQSAFVDPNLPITPWRYQRLLEIGFRRSGPQVYRPWCEACEACRSLRIPVAEFRPNRSQRRTRARNQDLRVLHRPMALRDEEFALYRAYTAARHGGSMAEASAEEYMAFLSTDWCETRLLCLYAGRQLLAVAVTDVLPNALSAVYTFFDPQQGRRALGVQAILTQLDWAQGLGLAHLYLGYWVANSRKMAYKAQYRPMEILLAANWRRINPGETPPA